MSQAPLGLRVVVCPALSAVRPEPSGELRVPWGFRDVPPGHTCRAVFEALSTERQPWGRVPPLCSLHPVLSCPPAARPVCVLGPGLRSSVPDARPPPRHVGLPGGCIPSDAHPWGGVELGSWGLPGCLEGLPVPSLQRAPGVLLSPQPSLPREVEAVCPPSWTVGRVETARDRLLLLQGHCG